MFCVCVFNGQSKFDGALGDWSPSVLDEKCFTSSPDVLR